MGAGQSKADLDEKVFHNDTPVQFSQDVVNHLSDQSASPETTTERQSTLDAHIRSRIRAEIEHLRKEEEDIRHEIEAALEKENLDHDRVHASAAGDESSIASSAVLSGDLEELRSKVDKYHDRKDLADFPGLKLDADALVACYRGNPTTPLDCWKEVQNFRQSVSKLEQHFLSTLH
ncbi:hypothetical protein BDN72DRAFT_869491 [Pluteus cervinus]|uniref:Uncharacterized protein n=1 Tax=Pluteus cervinus TaxID=181527 RepID=A0ACD3B3X4_9AGAR|nr:hypothetical protein BDN72DRAFT_869491 [Pluteus cervinus]